jgi:hypothetical protein
MRALFVLAAVAAVLALSGGAGAQSPTLFGTVGPGFLIRLQDGSGNPVKQLDPGTYTIQIDDKADIHNFHLTGPGVDKATDIEQVGTVTWTVTLANGTYHYQCDAHPSTMFGNVTVGTPPPPPPPPPPSAKPVTLVATVPAAGKVVLHTLAGKRVLTVKAGRVVIKVNDLSTTANFHLTGPGVNRLTPVAGKVHAIWKLTLRRGLYRFRSDRTPTVVGSFRAV